MPTTRRISARLRQRELLPSQLTVPPTEPATALRAVVGEVRDEAALVIGPQGIDVMCDLLRRGARSVVLLRTEKRPEAHSASLVVVPAAPSIEWLACVLGHARRALLPTGRLVLRLTALPGRQLAAQVMRMLRIHGYTLITARQAGDQLLLKAELPGFGQQICA